MIYSAPSFIIRFTVVFIMVSKISSKVEESKNAKFSTVLKRHVNKRKAMNDF